MNTNPSNEDLGGLDTPVESAQVGTSQVVNYSEFLSELARQRHTIVKSYASAHPLSNGRAETVRCHEKLLDDLDALIRDVLNHIQGNDLVATGKEPK